MRTIKYLNHNKLRLNIQYYAIHKIYVSGNTQGELNRYKTSSSSSTTTQTSLSSSTLITLFLLTRLFRRILTQRYEENPSDVVSHECHDSSSICFCIYLVKLSSCILSTGSNQRNMPNSFLHYIYLHSLSLLSFFLLPHSWCSLCLNPAS